MKLSVVIATWNRPQLLRRLLSQLAQQTLDDFEVIVVDDGSSPPVEAQGVHLIRQANAGAAAARHAGILAARGDIVVVVDDDMQVGPDFLARHLASHDGPHSVVLGRIRADPDLPKMPLFERWHAHLLDVKAEKLRDGRLQPRGDLLFTGNASFHRADYLAAGGFDRSLGQSEDIELGMRLEKAGATFRFSEDASTLHGSDHTSLRKWRDRARRYGACDLRIGRKHPDLATAGPWHRLLFDLNPITRSFVAYSLAAPWLAGVLTTLAIWMALAFDKLGLERVAFAATSLAYSMEYYRGVRYEAGSIAGAIRDLWAFARRNGRTSPPGWRSISATKGIDGSGSLQS
ncbi:MAG: glycosyltransferase family 2 protein [Myxococcales bacterium]|nr:glycosyltransferase [Myxococcales bacterium]